MSKKLKLIGKRLNSLVGLNIPEGTKVLDVSWNNLTSFEGLEISHLNSLTHFFCGCNQITSFEGLRLPNSLTHFSCSFNQIKNFEGLRLLDSLFFLFF